MSFWLDTLIGRMCQFFPGRTFFGRTYWDEKHPGPYPDARWSVTFKGRRKCATPPDEEIVSRALAEMDDAIRDALDFLPAPGGPLNNPAKAAEILSAALVKFSELNNGAETPPGSERT